MAFGQKITKEDLVAAGLDPDKLSEFQKNGVTKTDLDTLKTELATSVTDLIKAQFTELETKLRTPVQQNTERHENSDNHQKTAEEIEEERRTEFLTDPTTYITKQVQGVGAAAAIEFKRMSRDMAWRDLSRTLPCFKNETLKKEIEEEWKKYPPEKMAQYNTDPSLLLTQLHDMVLGKHYNEIEQDKDKKDGKYNLVHSGGGSGNTVIDNVNSNTNRQEPIVTPEIEAQAKKFEMTGKEWLDEQKEMAAEEVTRFVKVGA